MATDCQGKISGEITKIAASVYPLVADADAEWPKFWSVAGDTAHLR